MFFVKQKTAYEMRISDWSSDVCSSDLREARKDDIAGDLAKARIGIQRCGLFMGTRIVPQDAGAQHLVVRVEQGRAVHLAGEADALHGRQFLWEFLLQDRKSVVSGRRVFVRVDLGGRRSLKKNNK